MKKAFTMLELLFVLVVIGILAAVMLPETKSTKLREAAIQVVSHIRYTQHLAMIDDKFDKADAAWYKKRWQLIFVNTEASSNQYAYSIYSDANVGAGFDGNPNFDELALDPMDKTKYLSGGGSGGFMTSDSRANKNMNIGLSYGIEGVDFKGGCASPTVRRLTFDHLGRPMQGTIHVFNTSYEANKLIQTRCEIVLTSPEGGVTIAIEPESGYAHIL